MVQIVLAEDHLVVREALRVLLESEPDLEVVGQTHDGNHVVPLVESVRPDVVVLDLMLPGLGGLEVIRQLARSSCTTRVVVLSMHDSEAYVIEALRSGALGYALKQAEAAELVRAIREVAAGRRYLSPPLSDRALEAYARSADRRSDPYDTLTARERVVLRLVAQGHTSAVIGGELFISPRTVETHRANLMNKLGLRSQADVVRFAMREGILSPDS
jgi:DNA-binding NarL/FixJ family response regulator